MNGARGVWVALALLALEAGCSSSHGGSAPIGSGSGSGSGGPLLLGSGTGASGRGSSSGTGTGSSSGTGTGSGSMPAGSNVAPLVVDNGPPGAEGSVDVPFVTVTLCVPGTSNCQTIDHVSVDTGSSGMRVIATVLTLALPQVNASDGNPEAECLPFADGYTWGSVRTADLKIGGEVAAHIPIQVIGDTSVGSAPSDCSSQGSAENTVATFGSNGLVGINQIVPDCGDYCASGSPQGSYYSCTGGNCTDTTVAVSAQISNPVAFFAEDTNGLALAFASVPAGGATTSVGTITFGIGTQSNNALGSAKVMTTDEYGNFTTTFSGASFPTSFLDSGTNTLSFNDSSIAACTGQLEGFYCPTSTLSFMATNTGQNSVSEMVSFSVGDAQTIFNSNDSSVSDLGTTGLDNMTFDWGFPFFLGRTIFLGLAGATTPGGPGPYYAY